MPAGVAGKDGRGASGSNGVAVLVIDLGRGRGRRSRSRCGRRSGSRCGTGLRWGRCGHQHRHRTRIGIGSRCCQHNKPVLRRPVESGQYTSVHFTEHLALEGIAPSIGSVGDAYDNALMENMIGLYKTECIRRGPFHNGPLRALADVEYATVTWVECGTTPGCTSPSATCHRPSTKPPTTLRSPHSNRSRGPYEAGREPVTLQSRRPVGPLRWILITAVRQCWHGSTGHVQGPIRPLEWRGAGPRTPGPERLGPPAPSALAPPS